MAKPENRKIALRIAYDGSAYYGWQRQSDKPTIQGKVEDVFSKIFDTEINIHGSGRTDAGVHALAQVAHAQIPRPFQAGELLKATNSLLPQDIRIREISSAHADFHARQSALAKKYTYVVNMNKVMSPFAVNYALHVPHNLNLEAMMDSLSMLEGKHDFTHFTTPDAIGTTAERNILAAYLEEREGYLYISIKGNGFLRYTVRTIIGTLLKIGRESISQERMQAVLCGNAINPLPITLKVSGCGLYLTKVYYDCDIFSQREEMGTSLLKSAFPLFDDAN